MRPRHTWLWLAKNVEGFSSWFEIVNSLCILRELQKGAWARRTLLMVTAALVLGGGIWSRSGGESPSNILVHKDMDSEMEVRLYPPYGEEG